MGNIRSFTLFHFSLQPHAVRRRGQDLSSDRASAQGRQIALRLRAHLRR